MMPLTMSGTNYDYDYDVIQPFFLDGEEEDFYLPPHRQLLPGPDEDIWKKFELLPTPPVSPSRTSSPCAAPLSAEDHLEAVYELLDEDHTSTSLLQSFIIQDCMWSSSFAAAAKLERVVSARLECLRARRESSAADSVVPGASDSQPDRPQMDSEYLKDLQAAASDCIDPSEVFQQTQGGNAAGLDSPPISSSDSESEEEEMDNDEEEEVDVVTVEGQRTCRRPDASPLVLKRSHINTHQHNYAAQQPARKRAKPASSAAKPGGGRRCWSPRSDGEDDDKRRTHNVLERQRRNELRRSFLALRDHIPAVAGNEKAAKVAILKTATEFIAEIQEDERRLLAAKEELRSRSRELRRRLEQLRT